MNTYKRINIAGSGGGSAELNYQLTFDNSASWGSAVNGEYTITINQSTHQKGNNPQVQVFEETSANVFEIVTVNSTTILSNGNVLIKILETPDLRFAGKIIIS